jgi:hypothetical protein
MQTPCAQVRWAAVLGRWLPKIKSRVTLTVPWRPFYDAIRQTYKEPMRAFVGARSPCTPCHGHLHHDSRNMSPCSMRLGADSQRCIM